MAQLRTTPNTQSSQSQTQGRTNPSFFQFNTTKSNQTSSFFKNPVLNPTSSQSQDQSSKAAPLKIGSFGGNLKMGMSFGKGEPGKGTSKSETATNPDPVESAPVQANMTSQPNSTISFQPDAKEPEKAPNEPSNPTVTANFFFNPPKGKTEGEEPVNPFKFFKKTPANPLTSIVGSQVSKPTFQLGGSQNQNNANQAKPSLTGKDNQPKTPQAGGTGKNDKPHTAPSPTMATGVTGLSNPSFFNNQMSAPLTAHAKPTIESINHEKFLNKRVVEVHAEWERATREVQTNVKRVAMAIHRNEEDLRSGLKTLDSLFESKREAELEFRVFDESLDKILSQQKSLEMQFDFMEGELDRLLDSHNVFDSAETRSDDLYAKCQALSDRLIGFEEQSSSFGREINGHCSKSSLDVEFNSSFNNYFESLTVLHCQMDQIEQKLSKSVGVANFI